MDIHRFLTGLFRRFRSFVLRNEVQVVGQCKFCGECCRDILLRDKGRWIRTEKQFRKLCEDAPNHSRFFITGKDEYGNLTFTCGSQQEDDLCSCHDDRLPLCRNYPAKSLYYQGSSLGPSCGYAFRALSFRDVWMRRRRGRIPPFSDILRRELERKKE